MFSLRYKIQPSSVVTVKLLLLDENFCCNEFAGFHQFLTGHMSAPSKPVQMAYTFAVMLKGQRMKGPWPLAYLSLKEILLVHTEST